MTRNIRLWTALLALCLLATGCNRPWHKKEVRVVKVNVMEVHNESQASSHEYVGTLAEGSSCELSFSMAGRVTAVYVKDGQYVHEGQLLASVDKTKALSSYKAAQATLNQARDGYDRAKQVHDQGGLPEVRWVEIQTDLQKAESMYEIAQQNLKDCDLYAPQSGTVDGRNISRGSSVTPFQPVMRLLDLSQLYARISVPEGDVSTMRVGDTATVVLYAGGEEKTVRGVIDERTPSADRLSHGYTVRLRLSRRPQTALPGMVCKVRFVNSLKPSGIELPNRAVQLAHDGQRFVWVVIDGETFPRKVKVGDLTRTGVIITEGLNEGDKVVTDGMVKISTGTKVETES